MATPGPEWMIWAKRLKDEHVELLQTIQKYSSTIAEAPIPVQVTDLQVSHRALHDEVKSLREAVTLAQQRQEQESRKLNDRVTSLEEEKKALVEAVELSRTQSQLTIKQATQRYRDLITQQIEQIYQLQAQHQQQAKEIATLRAEHAREIAALRPRDRASNEFGANVAELGFASQLNASNLENISQASGNVSFTRHYCEKEAKRPHNWSGQAALATSDQGSDSEETRDSSEGPEHSGIIFQSEASTNDSLVYALEPRINARARDPRSTSLSAVAIKPQRGLALEEYLIRSDDDIQDRLPEYEKKLVEAFVAGMAAEEQRATLETRLQERGWTWKIAYEEVNQIVEDEIAKRNKRKARYLRPRAADGKFAPKKQRRV